MYAGYRGKTIHVILNYHAHGDDTISDGVLVQHLRGTSITATLGKASDRRRPRQSRTGTQDRVVREMVRKVDICKISYGGTDDWFTASESLPP